MRQDYEESLKQSESTETYSAVWDSDEKNFATLGIIADGMIDSYGKDSKFVGIGQSPAWIVETLKAKGIDACSVPFSGKFFSGKRNGECIKFDLCKYDKMPSEENIKDYQEYLIKIGLDPKQIVKDYKELQKKTIIVDYAKTGEGLASFLYVLTNLAKEWLSKEEFESFLGALKVNIFSEEGGVSEFIIGKKERFIIKVQVSSDDSSMHLVKMLANSEFQELESDRIVPSFNLHKDSKEIVCTCLEKNERINEIMRKIQNLFQQPKTSIVPESSSNGLEQQAEIV
jgi:hypothetical protein